MNKKILLIDDNKMLGKLLAKKIQTTLNHEVDIVFSLAEVKALPNDEYFLTLQIYACLMHLMGKWWIMFWQKIGLLLY